MSYLGVQDRFQIQMCHMEKLSLFIGIQIKVY